jgi:hypothetical protein
LLSHPATTEELGGGEGFEALADDGVVGADATGSSEPAQPANAAARTTMATTSRPAMLERFERSLGLI